MEISKFKKIVIKIGSSILIDKKGKPKKKWLKEFARDIKNLTNKKKQIVTKRVRVSGHMWLRRPEDAVSDESDSDDDTGMDTWMCPFARPRLDETPLAQWGSSIDDARAILSFSINAQQKRRSSTSSQGLWIAGRQVLPVLHLGPTTDKQKPHKGDHYFKLL